MSLDLARHGHPVTAARARPRLLGALASVPQTSTVSAVGADARAFKLARRDFALCLVPMQTVQLLGGPPAGWRSCAPSAPICATAACSRARWSRRSTRSTLADGTAGSEPEIARRRRAPSTAAARRG